MITGKKITLWIVIIVFLTPILGWILMPGDFPFIARIWILVGKPDILQRLMYFGIFVVVVFVLSIRLLKSGPI